MITLKGLILPHQQKADGTINVKIRVTHNRMHKYLPTNIYVTKKQLNGKQDKITDRDIIKKINDEVEDLRRIADDIPNSTLLNVNQIVDILKKGIDRKVKVEVNFIEFGREVIKKMKMGGNIKTADGYQTVINSLEDFFGSNKVMITDITAKSLQKYEDYLRSERTITRINQHGKPVTIVTKPLGNGINNYMRIIRALFNDALHEFNDEDREEIVITHYPFSKYKIQKPEPASKRNVKVDVIKQIRDSDPTEKVKRAVLGRDVFILSFYLVGINLIDLLAVDKFENGRLTYNRSKTESRRDDKALISIKVEPEVLPLIEKYADPSKKRVFNFYHHYSTSNTFAQAVNSGLKSLSEELELPVMLTSYYARHSWATIARNICRVSKADISFALNHTDPTHKVTDTYLEIDWTIIDRANRKVLDTLKETKKDDHDEFLEMQGTREDIQSYINDGSL